MLVLRFTTNVNEKRVQSEDQVNKRKFNGLCGYDISDAVSNLVNDDYTIEEAINIVALKQVKHDNWHAHNTKGKFVVFEGDFVEFERDNQSFDGSRAIIASINNYEAIGIIDMESEYYRIKELEII